MFSVIRNVSVPYGLNTPEEPNISSTRWRTVVDHKRRLYFFESALTPNTFWVDLKAIDLSAATGTVRMLDLGPNQDHTYSGNATKEFKACARFSADSTKRITVPLRSRRMFPQGLPKCSRRI